jgi:metal-dependent amidase/aminoacylase/carboxypeptidase family protein
MMRCPVLPTTPQAQQPQKWPDIIRNRWPALSESATIEAEMRRIATGTAATYDVACDVTYTRVFVPTVNHPDLAAAALSAAREALGGENVGEAADPNTGSEDFARFLHDLVVLIDAHKRHDWLVGAVTKRLRQSSPSCRLKSMMKRAE